MHKFPRVLSLLALTSTLLLSGCSAMPDWVNPTTWFEDEEEAKIRALAPIEAKFTPRLVWQQQVGNGVEHYFSRLKPAFGYNTLVVASRKGVVKALSPETGKTLWRKSFSAGTEDGFIDEVGRLWAPGESARISGGLSMAYERVYFGTENGDIYALNVKDGSTVWHVELPGEVLAAPAIDSGVVVVNTGAGVMFGLDAETGEQRWRHESEVPPLSLRGVAAPTVEGGGAIIGTASGRISVTLLESGQIAWEQAVGQATGATELERIVDIDSRPLVYAGVIYVISFDGSLAALELRSGRVIWKREYKSYRRVTSAGNSLFVSDAQGIIYALDRRNGIELWSQSGLKQRLLTGAEPVGDYVVVGDKYGFVHWLDQSSGDIVARINIGGDDTDGGIYAAPVVNGKIFYTQTRDGRVVAVATP